MAEETEGAGAQASGAPDTSGLALDLAMEEARSDPSLREDVAAFLRDQRALIEIQKHHLQTQFKPQMRQLYLGIWEKRLGVLLRVATGFVGLAVAAGLAFLIWNAAQSNQMVMDSFQVPPDMAARGLSGPVVAAKLSDRIAAMQAQTISQRAPRSYAYGISDGLELEIPETGVSLAELDRFLRAKLGRDLHIGGELVQAGNGIALTARVGNDSATVTGTEAEMDALLQKLAEQVYRITQPYRFSVWVQAQGRTEEGVAVLKEIASGNGPAKERAWGYNGWNVATTQAQSSKAGLALLRTAHALDPDNYLVLQNMSFAEMCQGHAEEAVRINKLAAAALTAHGEDYTQPERIVPLTQSYAAVVSAHQGALLEAAAQQRNFLDASVSANAPSYSRLAGYLVGLHERTAALAAAAQNVIPQNIANQSTYKFADFEARLMAAVEAQDWTGVLAAEADYVALMTKFPGFVEDKAVLADPFMALALAHRGRFAEAEARLKATPGDCYPCLRIRAQVAALQGQHDRADWWFARAAAIAPTSPYADEEWGRALLDRKQPDAAIAKFTTANRIGPKFADALQGWGEALMAKNQSHLALEKFAAAEKLAPNWGRLHLKWGQALTYAGKPEEAKAKFARAATLDLTPSEKSELARARP